MNGSPRREKLAPEGGRGFRPPHKANKIDAGWDGWPLTHTLIPGGRVSFDSIAAL